MTIPIARLTIRRALKELEVAERKRSDDLLVVTGKGGDGGYSPVHEEAVSIIQDHVHDMKLRQRVGSFVIPREGIQRWLERQEKEK